MIFSAILAENSIDPFLKNNFIFILNSEHGSIGQQASIH